MPMHTYRCPSCDRTEDAIVPDRLKDDVNYVPKCPPKPWHPLKATVVMVRVPFASAPHAVVKNPAVPKRVRG